MRAPVRPGDVLHGTMEIVEIRPRDDNTAVVRSRGTRPSRCASASRARGRPRRAAHRDAETGRSGPGGHRCPGRHRSARPGPPTGSGLVPQGRQHHLRGSRPARPRRQDPHQPPRPLIADQGEAISWLTERLEATRPRPTAGRCPSSADGTWSRALSVHRSSWTRSTWISRRHSLGVPHASRLWYTGVTPGERRKSALCGRAVPIAVAARRRADRAANVPTPPVAADTTMVSPGSGRTASLREGTSRAGAHRSMSLMHQGRLRNRFMPRRRTTPVRSCPVPPASARWPSRATPRRRPPSGWPAPPGTPRAAGAARR